MLSSYSCKERHAINKTNNIYRVEGRDKCSGKKLNAEYGVGRMMDIMLNWVVRDKPIDMVNFEQPTSLGR